MKYLKILVLSAVAAAALMATAGAGTALANTTVLCTGTGEPSGGACPAGPHEETWEAGKTIHLEATNTKLTTSLVNTICASSKMTMTPEADHSEGAITGGVAMSFSECNTESGTKCEVTVRNMPYAAHWEGTVAGNTNISALAVTSTEEHPMEITMHCGAFINCTLGQESVTFEGVNGEPSELKTNNLSLTKASGTFCPEKFHWEATYKATDTITVH